MEPPDDLTDERVHQALPGRTVLTTPVTVATETDLVAWAKQQDDSRSVDGAVAVAGHQEGPRGRAGLSWGDLLEPGHGLGFSVLLDGARAAAAGGASGLYLRALLAVHDELDGNGALALEWPDRILRDEDVAAAVGVRDRSHEPFAVVSVVVPGAEPPRTRLLAALAASLERRLDDAADEVAAGYRERCATLGRSVRARLLPLGPSATILHGDATDVRADGALVITSPDGGDTVVSPDELGFLEDPGEQVRPDP